MQLTPYLMFNGQCEEALNFYVQALNGQITQISHYDDAPMETPSELAKKVMHATFSAGGFSLMASDSGSADIVIQNGDNVQLSLNFESVEEEKKRFDALAEGGTVKMPLQDTFWGAHFGMLVDKFGVHWLFNCDKQ